MMASLVSGISSINASGVRNIAALGHHLQPYPGDLVILNSSVFLVMKGKSFAKYIILTPLFLQYCYML